MPTGPPPRAPTPCPRNWRRGERRGRGRVTWGLPARSPNPSPGPNHHTFSPTGYAHTGGGGGGTHTVIKKPLPHPRNIPLPARDPPGSLAPFGPDDPRRPNALPAVDHRIHFALNCGAPGRRTPSCFPMPRILRDIPVLLPNGSSEVFEFQKVTSFFKTNTKHLTFQNTYNQPTKQT